MQKTMQYNNVLTENKNIQNQSDYLMSSQNSQHGGLYKQDYSQLFYQFIHKIEISSNKIIDFYDDFLIKKLDLAEQHIQQISKLSQFQKPRKRVETNIKSHQAVEKSKEQIQDLKRVKKVPFYDENSTKKIFDDKCVNNLSKDLLQLDLEAIDYFQSSQKKMQSSKRKAKSSSQMRSSIKKQKKSESYLQKQQQKLNKKNEQESFKININGQEYKNSNGKDDKNENLNKKNQDSGQSKQTNKNQQGNTNINQNTTNKNNNSKLKKKSSARKSLIMQFSEMKVQNKHEIQNDKKQIQEEIQNINIEDFCQNALKYTYQQQKTIEITKPSSNNHQNTKIYNQQNSLNSLTNTLSTESQNSFKENEQFNENLSKQLNQQLNQKQKFNQQQGYDFQQYFNDSFNSQSSQQQQQQLLYQQLLQEQQIKFQKESQQNQQQKQLQQQSLQLYQKMNEQFNGKQNSNSNDQYNSKDDNLQQNSQSSQEGYLKLNNKSEEYDPGMVMTQKQMFQDGFKVNNDILDEDEDDDFNEYEITDYSSNESSNMGSPVFNWVKQEEIQNEKNFFNDQNSCSQQNNIYYMNKFNSKNNNIFESSVSYSEENSKNFNNPIFNNPVFNSSQNSSQNSFGFMFDKPTILNQENSNSKQKHMFFSQETFAGMNFSNINQQKDNMFQIDVGNNLLLSQNDSNSMQQFQYYQNKKLLESPQKLKTVKQRKILYCNNKQVPKWAYNLPSVTQKVREQNAAGKNPFEIFGYFAVENLNLREVFKNTGKRYDEGRGSSACWRKDYTPEQIEYLINATSQTPNKKQKIHSKFKSFLQNSFNSIKKKLIS